MSEPFSNDLNGSPDFTTLKESFEGAKEGGWGGGILYTGGYLKCWFMPGAIAISLNVL